MPEGPDSYSGQLVLIGRFVVDAEDGAKPSFSQFARLPGFEIRARATGKRRFDYPEDVIQGAA